VRGNTGGGVSPRFHVLSEEIVSSAEGATEFIGGVSPRNAGEYFGFGYTFSYEVYRFRYQFV
ncbi:MAG: hypothetical protein K6E86_08510, partial [Bacteroidales bacterium]|nr:hypothetical protein [Bacteroidales bacterium]